jgi:hypothetical protein
MSALISYSQLEEDFSPTPSGWTLSQGANFQTLANGNGVILTAGVGGNNPAVVGTPAVNRTSGTVKICLDIWAVKTSDINTPVAFPTATYMDVLFVKSSVTTANDAEVQANIYARLDNYLLPSSGGNTCFTFTFPDNVGADFKIFLSFHFDGIQQSTKYEIDNINISGADDACSGSACPPTALDDIFSRGNPEELSVPIVLYGSNTNYPVQATGFVDATGTDNDQNDTYTHLRWELVAQPSNGSVTISPDGTATVTRNDHTVAQVVFTYRLCDDGADDNFATTVDNLCDLATVTVNFAVAIVTPVNIINYSGYRNGSDAVIKWTTTFEGNNKGFEIQRSTGSQNAYTTVAFVNSKAANGKSGVSLNYEFKENNNATAITWYRLVQVDLDGARKVFAVKAIRGLESTDKMLVYPNPATGGSTNVLFGSSSVRDITVTDISGRLVNKWSGYKNDNLSVKGLHAGIYFLTVTDVNTRKKSVEKIIVSE